MANKSKKKQVKKPKTKAAVWAEIIDPTPMHKDKLHCVEHNRATRSLAEPCDFKLVPPRDGKTPEECRARAEEREARLKMMWDHTKYVSENYDQRRTVFSADVISLVDTLWASVRVGEVDVRNPKVILVVTMYAELWGWINKVIKSEHEALNCYLPTQLLDRFFSYFPIMEHTVKSRIVTDRIIQDLLVIRDEVVHCLEVLYGHRYAMAKNQASTVVKTNTEQTYRTYDEEWLTTVSSRRQLSGHSKWTTVSRINQMTMSLLRLRIFNAAGSKSAELIERDESDVYRHLDDEDTLDVLEQTLMDLFDDSYHLLAIKHKNNAVLEEIYETAFFFNIRSSVSRKRRMLEQILVEESLTRDEMNATQEYIGVLVILETHMLIMEKVFTPVADKWLGIFSKIPKNVLAIIMDIQLGAKSKNEKYPRTEDFVEQLNMIRSNMQSNIKDHFIHVERRLEPMCVEPVNIEKEKLPFKEKHVVAELSGVLRNLKIEEIEKRRLAQELKFAWASKKFPPNANLPEYTMNKFAHKHVLVFRSNYRAVNTAYMALQLEGSYAVDWAFMRGINQNHPSKVISFIKSEARRFVLRQLPPMRKCARDALILSFMASIITHFTNSEVTNEVICHQGRATLKIRAMSQLFKPFFDHFLDNDGIYFDDYSEVARDLWIEYIQALQETGRTRSELSLSVTSIHFIQKNDLQTMAMDFINFVDTCDRIMRL